MEKKEVYIGKNKFYESQNDVSGEIVNIDNQECYKISNYSLLKPFFMNIVSNCDLWMFISSNGSLTAGRRNSDNSLFPYYTDDKIHDSWDISGPKTLILVHKQSQSLLWEPFSSQYTGIYKIERNIYKSIFGNFILFEEINHDLGINFQYSWSNCDKYGFVRKSKLINIGREKIEIDIIDGLQNILPAQLNRRLQMEYSNLVDAYKSSELLSGHSLAAFTLSSVPTDKAEPSESLQANISWTCGLENYDILLSSDQIDDFRKAKSISPEIKVRGKRGAFFVNSHLEIAVDDKKVWYILADVNKDQSEFISLAKDIQNNSITINKIESQIALDNELLYKKIARNDGSQLVNDKLMTFRHSSNVLFNIMRGGIFQDNYTISKSDFINFIKKANFIIYEKFADKFETLPENFNLNEIQLEIQTHDKDLERLVYEYLPLSFSRRHGDPSRPWNHFSIDIKDESGNPKLDYQGNWRDIFQNWEALALSFPLYIEKMIVKFVNASTADGYNPYRVTRDGFEWETIEPDDEWSYIGYWGDHQIIYLLKLLELSKKYNPEKLIEMFDKEIFVFANVPYKIKSYKEIISDPKNTIDFDFELNDTIMRRVEKMGFDGKFLYYNDGQIVYTTLIEKLLLPLLVKLSNFIPGAGIWMNTQRPEWNDANNALVGNGVSMVTLYYLRRYVAFLSEMMKSLNKESYKVSNEVFEYFVNMKNYFIDKTGTLKQSISDTNRREFLDHVGKYGSDYRKKLYEIGFEGKKNELNISDISEFLDSVTLFIDESILSNKREDILYHSYNLINISDSEIKIRRLYEMLEGQVAVLSSGILSTNDSIELLKSIKNSSLFRDDQMSYMLYPNRKLPNFIEKNLIPIELIKNDNILGNLADSKVSSILVKDSSENWHFNSKYRNARILNEDLLKKKEQNILSDKEIESLLNLYEQVFDHKSFTGRSGTFFKYEGLGSIYWHMVSKLLLAVQETFFRAVDENASSDKKTELKKIYYEIKEGLGIHKNPLEYGSFPTDPYSHTPENSGVQQPGMTGQVKEDIITRFGELGLNVDDGRIIFRTHLLNENEFLTQRATFVYYDVNNCKQIIELDKEMLAFTVCQVPIVYKKSVKNRISVFYTDKIIQISGSILDEEISESIFKRVGIITKIEVEINLNN